MAHPLMKILLHVEKSLEENAAHYYDRAKKVAKKREGAAEALAQNKEKLATLLKKRDKELVSKEEHHKAALRKKEWYEKFRWFFSSEGFLVIGGRDATSNEVVIKKHTESNDVVFHTDMAGSPFFVIKTEGKAPGEATLKEVADATATFSRAWKLGLAGSSTFWVTPDQVSKKTMSGEYMGKGAFMIYGKSNHLESAINLAVGSMGGVLMAGPREAIQKNCPVFLEIVQGDEKMSDIAKSIRSKLKVGTLDEIIRSLPAGGAKIKKG